LKPSQLCHLYGANPGAPRNGKGKGKGKPVFFPAHPCLGEMDRHETGVSGTREYAPRRDDESEALSVAMQKHVEGRETWQAVLLRAQEFTMQGKAAEAMIDTRNAYALMSDQAVLAGQEVQKRAKNDLTQ